ncbi:MAG TPA: hypothetical protein VMS56_13145 [Thermoanaerobaculia bacterium]|nr:hypothetical protein [Thermoanaerobaculia bacterium]
MPNKNAQVIIPFVIVVWLVAMLFYAIDIPPVFGVLGIVAFAIAVPVMVFYLMGEAGWRRLAKDHRQVTPPPGAAWTLVATGQMALVSVDHPQFQRVKMRFVGALRVATTADALHLSTIFSPLPVLGWFFPPLQIPWSAVDRARPFEAPGWFRPASQPGAIFQAGYDPNYTGTFVEMEVGQPPVFIQLPEPVRGENLSRLGLQGRGSPS